MSSLDESLRQKRAAVALEIRAARVHAAYESGLDTDDDFADPIVCRVFLHSVGLADLTPRSSDVAYLAERIREHGE